MIDSLQHTINKKLELLNTLKFLPKDCVTPRCYETLKEAQNIFNAHELETIMKKLKIKFNHI
jgi:hypothetical protein